MLGFSKIPQGQSVFDSYFYSLDNGSKYKYSVFLLCLLAFPPAFLSLLFLLFLPLVKKLFATKSYFFIFLRSRLHNVVIGDCVAQVFLRQYSPNGRITFNTDFVKVTLIACFKFYLFSFFVDYLKYFCNYNIKYFIAQEDTYFDELLRRILLDKGFQEIRLDYSSGNFLPFKKNSDFLSVGSQQFNAKCNRSFDYATAQTALDNFVFRKVTYTDLVDCDISNKIKLQIDDNELGKFFKRKQIAVVFLHQVSDAAYLFGVDCFDDLHHWLIETLKILYTLGFIVVIKLHPAYFSLKMTYPIDIKYMNCLQDIFSVNFSSMNENLIYVSSFPNVYFVHYKVPCAELNRSFPDFLCITHHGTVALEAAHLGHTVVASHASPYNKSCDFVCTYSSVDEYRELVTLWSEGHLRNNKSSRKVSLYEYYFKRINHLHMESKLGSLRGLLNFNLDSNDQFLHFLRGIHQGSSDYYNVENFLSNLI